MAALWLLTGRVSVYWALRQSVVSVSSGCVEVRQYPGDRAAFVGTDGISALSGLPSHWEWSSFYMRNPVPSYDGTDCYLRIPFWPLVPLLLTASVMLGWREVRDNRRVRAGRCRSCGYDRRGLAEDAPCPECGAE
jgi:hypothetical protein